MAEASAAAAGLAANSPASRAISSSSTARIVWMTRRWWAGAAASTRAGHHRRPARYRHAPRSPAGHHPVPVEMHHVERLTSTGGPLHRLAQASPERTYALVVGIESYDAGSSWDLDGPAKDAARFASWLLDRGVPAAQMLLFLSPLPGQPLGVSLPPGLTVRPAQHEPMTEAIMRTLSGWRGDLFWLFWAGHGVLTRDEHLRLFYSDASVSYKRNLELSSLLTALRPDLYAGLPRQIGVVDACQTYAERLQLATTLPAETLPYGQPLPGRDQLVLYGASPGQVAVYLGTVRAGLFSQIVMEELASQGGDGWPPAMERVAGRLDQRFSELRAVGRADQTPTSFRWRPWTGGERILGEAGPAPEGPPAGAAGRPARAAARGRRAEPHTSAAPAGLGRPRGPHRTDPAPASKAASAPAGHPWHDYALLTGIGNPRPCGSASAIAFTQRGSGSRTGDKPSMRRP
jgi:Caspase domain